MYFSFSYSDPQDNVEFADALYNNVVFLDSLYSALSEDGIIAMQLGEAPHFSSPSEELSIDKNRVIILDLMEKAGFKSFHVYEEVSLEINVFISLYHHFQFSHSKHFFFIRATQNSWVHGHK